ncbi:hypothetical protein HA402_011826 [Bradysia odoriphaga]|nr:hypothetical protein HA402_011826 [Bradysia odoriphaga]
MSSPLIIIPLTQLLDGTKYSEDVRCKYTLSICYPAKKKFGELTTECSFGEQIHAFGWSKFLAIEELYRQRDALLQNNTLHIRVDMCIYGEHSTSTSLLSLYKSKGTVNPVEVLTVDLGQLFNNKSNSDVEIVCGTETLYAHRLILSARSKVFTAMLESDMRETATSKIVLTDIDAEIFRAILLYIYTGKVEMNDSISYVELIYGAEKYDLAELKQYCFEQMCKSVTIDTIGSLAVAAEVYNADENIRKPIKEYCRRNMTELLAKDPAIKNLMISHPTAFL